jgi:signal transduction histidine kinase
MVIRGTLFRLAAWYFLLLVLILGCLDVIVYFSLSEALHSRISADLQNRARQAIQDLDITQGTVRTPQIYNDPTYADTIIYVIQTKGEQEVLVRNDPHALGLDHLPNPNGVAAAKKGSTNENEVSLSGQPFDVRTQPVYDRAGDLVGVLQVAKPIAQIQDDLDRLARQLGIASAVALFMGAIAAFLMAYKSLRPLRVAFQRQREFVADASHELRTPLTLIRTNAEALLRRARNTGAADYARSILEEVDQLNTIVSDLGTLALADARELPVEREPVELERRSRP